MLVLFVITTGASEFETSHKIKSKDLGEFETSHKKPSYLTQKKFFSKEKPELNPVLSALIGEDIKANIEAKRQAEYTTPATSLTTQNGLIDSHQNLDFAGSENKQTSKIQIKKGPNGQDYEYEYVYYYYDDDENNDKKSLKADDDFPDSKTRYTTIDRTSATAGQNSVGSQGRALTTDNEESEDPERLPVNTRFPPRAKNVAPTQTPEQKKISVKRPSLELVDSDSFNTNEKLQKGNRNMENVDKFSDARNAEESPEKSEVKLYEENTTDLTELSTEKPGMEKVALDLYALITNANFDSSTMINDEDSTASTIDPEFTTVMEDTTETELIPETTPTTTTTTTTTTPAPTTTTTTTPAPTTATLVGRGGANRNRFGNRRNQNSRATSTEAPVASPETTGKSKPRFSRPNFSNGSGRNRFSAPDVEPQIAAEPAIEKEEANVIQSSKPELRSKLSVINNLNTYLSSNN